MPLDGTLYEDEILRVLRAAQERIRNPANWCQDFLNYLTADGATQYCARGALLKVTNDSIGHWSIASPDRAVAADKLLCQAAVEAGYTETLVGDPEAPLGSYQDKVELELWHQENASVHLNNNSDHSTVMAMFDRAQELRRAEIMETVEA